MEHKDSPQMIPGREENERVAERLFFLENKSDLRSVLLSKTVGMIPAFEACV